MENSESMKTSMGISSDTSTEWFFIHCFLAELNFGSVPFYQGK